MAAHLTRIRLEHWLLSAILLLAVGLRVAAIDYDLPDIYHPDEPAVIRISREMFATGDLNPHFFDSPSLIFYSNALIYTPLYLILDYPAFSAALLGVMGHYGSGHN